MKRCVPLLLFAALASAGQFETYIKKRIPEGARVIQFGTHAKTDWMARRYEVFTIESRIECINEHETQYVFAPVCRGWYDRDALKKFGPKEYDFILINNEDHQLGILENLDLIKQDVPIFVTDDQCLAEELASSLGRKCIASEESIQ